MRSLHLHRAFNGPAFLPWMRCVEIVHWSHELAPADLRLDPDIYRRQCFLFVTLKKSAFYLSSASVRHDNSDRAGFGILDLHAECEQCVVRARRHHTEQRDARLLARAAPSSVTSASRGSSA